jgi:CHAD domain-containing protein
METVLSLCSKHNVDMAHARCVAQHALQLFDATQPLHTLEPRARELVEAGALLHNIGMSLDVENHHSVGRDIVMATQLKGYSQAERAMLACCVAFHRRDVDPGVEPIFNALGEGDQQNTLILGAMIRVADGLDYAQTQRTVIDSIDVDVPRRSVTMRSSGPHSHEDAARATRKADLWRTQLGELRATGRLTAPGLTADMTLAEAGRRIMRYHADQVPPEHWRPTEEEAQSGVDDWPAKRIKAMRVAVRRLRMDLRLFGAYYKRKTLRPLARGAKLLADALREPRELDMLLSGARAYQQACDEEGARALDALVTEWKQQRRDARNALIAYLHSEEHEGWHAALTEFVSGETDVGDRKPAVGEPSHVRHAAQLLLWQHIAQVRARDVLPDLPEPDALHAVRVDVKRLRYVADALSEVLPAALVPALIEDCMRAQREYGLVNDAHVSAQRALEFVAAHRGARKLALKGIVQFAEAQQRVVDEHLRAWRQALMPLLQQPLS